MAIRNTVKGMVAAAPVAPPAPVVEEVEVEVYAKEKGGKYAIFLSRDRKTKVYRVATIDSDGMLHIRPGNQASGLKVDAQGHVQIVLD